MEVKLICDCEECYSCFLELGCVNILIDIPSKLLRNFSETLKGPLTCDFDSSCELYEKLNCSQIHVILITNSRGFEGLDLLSHFYDLNSTHIVCTRPVYVLATIYYQNNNLKDGRSNKDDKFKGFLCKKLLNNLKEVKYNDGFSLTDFVNNNLLHLISYNELLKIDVTTSDSNYFHVRQKSNTSNTNFSSNVSKDSSRDNLVKNELTSVNNRTDLLNDFNVELELVAMSNGYSLGSCNYLVKHENLSEKIVLISKSSDRRRYTRSFNYSIFDNLNKDDVIVLLSNSLNGNLRCSFDNKVVKGSNYVDEVDMMGENRLYKTDQDQKLELKQERMDQHLVTKEDEHLPGVKEEKSEEDMDVDEFQKQQLFDNENEESSGDSRDDGATVVDSKSKDDKDVSVDEKDDEVDCLGLYCVDKIVRGNSVLIPLDFNYEYLVDLLESLNRCIKRMKKQVFVYCVGKGVEDMFDYLEKCCEWVREDRSEYSMHSEDPKSPFPELDEMKLNNQLFVSDSVNGIANLYRVPSVLILIMNKEEELLNYLNNSNNRFLILQNKFNKLLVNNYSSNNLDYQNNYVNNNYNYYKLNLEMDLSNINTNNRVVDLRRSYLSGSDTVRVDLHEDNVGFVRCQMDRGSFDDLRFFELDDDLKVNLFQVDLENMNEVVLKSEDRVVDKSDDEHLVTKDQYLPGVKQEKSEDGMDLSDKSGDDSDKGEQKGEVKEENSEDENKEKGKKRRGRKKKKKKGENQEQKLVITEVKDNTDSRDHGLVKDKEEKQNRSEEDDLEYDDIDELLMFGNYDYNKLVEQLKSYFNNQLIKVNKQSENRLVVLSSNVFNIVIDNDNKTTVIEALNDDHRKYILKSMQKLTLTL